MTTSSVSDYPEPTYDSLMQSAIILQRAAGIMRQYGDHENSHLCGRELWRVANDLEKRAVDRLAKMKEKK